MRAFVYYNLHKGCWSIKALDGSAKGRVVVHADRVLLRDCEFKVSEAGRQRVIRERKKNVHAGVVGELEGWTGDRTAACPTWFRPSYWFRSDARYAAYAKRKGVPVTYNPYMGPTFVLHDGSKWCGRAIHEADMVFMQAGGKSQVRAFDPLDMPE
jgi:hypothetical protein